LNSAGRKKRNWNNWCDRRRAAKADVQRAKVVLFSAQGCTGKEIARRVGLSEPTVVKWRQRFLAHRCLGLSELPRSGAPRRVSDKQIEEVIRQTLEKTPPAATHWSTRAMAKRCGFSRQTVSRIWRTFGLAPHRSENFTLSKDPSFADKVRDVVGLYLDPPANALVLCVDEKTQVQALEAQPARPADAPGTTRATHP
jgi:transposase